MRPFLSVAIPESSRLDATLRAGPDLLVTAAADSARAGQAGATTPRRFVRLKTFGDDDIAAVAAAGAEGVLLPRAGSRAEIEHLSALLAVAEARAGLADGALRIIACVSSGAGLLALPELAGASPRVGALGWDAAALAADLGAEGPREAAGGWIEPLAHARTRLLASAAAAGLPAIDTPSDLALDGFTAEAAAAWRHGFRAKFATNADQVEAIRSITNAARA